MRLAANLSRLTSVLLSSFSLVAAHSAEQEECYELHSNQHPTVVESVYTHGSYCLVEDIHARFDFADHPTQRRLIQIGASNVTIDLKGHILGRGRVFRNWGGVGIEIDPGVKNVTIKNGILRDFGACQEFCVPGSGLLVS